MILGHIGLNNSINQNYPQIPDLSANFGWSNSIEYIIDFGSFTGSVLSSNRLPISRKDYLFIDEECDLLVLVDGFIYNQKELSLSSYTVKQLELPLPELIYKLFLLKGPDFVKDLNGDFAICIYQKTINSIHFFRDHLGIRPLAIARTECGVFFSTDPLKLCKALNQNEKADADYLKNLFLGEAYNYTLLPNKKVKIVPPATYLQLYSGKEIISQYWFPEKIKKDQRLSSEKVISEIKELVYDAVKIRTDTKFNAAAHVSGGIDSGVVASLARKAYKTQNKFLGFSWSPTYTIQNKIIDFDERSLVVDICNSNNITPQFVDFTESNHLLQMKNWQYPSEFFFENKVIESAKSNEVNLIFSGWGGDEFISIANRGIDADLIKEFSWRSFLKKYPIRRPKNIVSSILFNVIFPASRRSYSRNKTDPAIYPYLKKRIGSNLIPKKKRFDYGSRRKVHLQLLNFGHLSDRTKDWYISGQHNGIEYRYPLLDKRIIEYMLKVPSHCLVGGNNKRILLRSIGKDILPEALLQNTSKNDPVKDYFFRKFATEANKFLITEFNIFRSNTELDFVDFNLLEKNIQLFLKTGDKKLEDSIWPVLYCLKRADEFTKGYNDHS